MDKDIFWYELNAYKTDIINIEVEIKRFMANLNEGENLTYFSLAISNRANLLLIGLCALFEAFLYQLSVQEENTNSLKIRDIRGQQGLRQLQTYLTRTNKVDFDRVPQWSTFDQIYILRNALVHSYGGMIETRFIKKVQETVKQLKIESALVGNRRIRLTSEILLNFHKVIEDLMIELKKAN